MNGLSKEYRELFERYVRQQAETDLEVAYEMGRRAIENGISVLDLIDWHYESLVEGLSRAGAPDESANVGKLASALLKEMLAPFDMASLGYRQTIEQLQGHNERLVNLMDERARLLQQREDFMMVVTHDLKTPITAADRALNLMLQGDFGEVSERISEMILLLKGNNQSMLRMVQNMLEAYRYEQGAPPLQLGKVDLRALVSSCLKELAVLADAGQLRLENQLPEDLAPVRGDESALRHVINNLVHNSIKFTRPGGLITVSGDNAGPLVNLRVTDTGRGISKEDQARLFQRFSQGEAGKKQYTGTGLGLFLCRQIVQAHDGDIHCESEVGKGTTFSISLPIWAE